MTAGAALRLADERSEDAARLAGADLLVPELAEAPIDPVSAIRPKARAKMASAAMATRLRIVLIRCLRVSDTGAHRRNAVREEAGRTLSAS